MRGQRGRLRALAGICHVHESYFWTSGSLFPETSSYSLASLSGFLVKRENGDNGGRLMNIILYSSCLFKCQYTGV